MRAITTDIKVVIGRLGPLVSKVLEHGIRRAMTAGHAEVTTDHLLRSLLDFLDSDLNAALDAAKVERRDIVARLDWHLGRLPGKHEGKPRLGHMLCLLLEDASKLTNGVTRSGHVIAALFEDPSLSAAGMADSLKALPRVALHLLASNVEGRGEIGRVAPVPSAAAPAAEAGKPAASAPAISPAAPVAVPAPEIVVPAAQIAPIAPAAEAVKQADSAPAPSAEVPQEGTAPRSQPANAAHIRALFDDRLVAEDEGGITLKAHVGGRETTVRLDWDIAGRVIVLRIALPGDPPADAVRTAVALSTLNNAIPHGTFIVDGNHIAYRSHVFMDADGVAPLEALGFAVHMCEEAAEAL